MSTLTPEQIDSFNTFAKGLKDWFDERTTGPTHARFFTERSSFGTVFDALIGPETGDGKDGRPSALLPVMNNITNMEKTGRTKEVFQLRYPDNGKDGEPHPQAGEKMYKRNGDPILSKHHAVMYTTDAYRAKRSEITGLKGKEPVYAIQWDAVPDWLKSQIQSKFPEKKEDYPVFTPLALGFLLKKGSKPKSGQKRHSWSGIDIVVGGKYGDQTVIIEGVYVQRRPGKVARIADALGLDCPDWGQSEPAAAEPDDAGFANVSTALLEECGF
jgi:hypothetical protein